MAAPTPPYQLTATQALALIKSNSLTVEEYAQSLLDRVMERDDVIKAWAYLDPVLVLEQARALDQKPLEERGPLHGLAIGVKDIMDTKDMPTEYGSPIYKGHRPASDSAAVSILRSAGALIFGKTTTTEFTITNSGPKTTNPCDPTRTPGGSSCGSAAAVADCQVPFSLGAQTGGSVIRPAAFTGVYALKPTYNAISLEGQKAFAPTFDTFGFFARSVEDLQLLTDVFAIDDDEPCQDLRLEEFSIALMKTPMWSAAGPGTASAMEQAAKVLRDRGVKVEGVDCPPEIPDADALKHMQKVITNGEGRISLLKEYRLDKNSLDPEIRGIVENAANYTRQERMDAEDEYAKMRRIMDDLAKGYTAILTPSAVDEAPVGLDDMGPPTFNTMWTGFHMPVINVPAFSGSHGMPIGLSLVGPRYRDQQLLQTAAILSQALMAKDEASI